MAGEIWGTQLLICLHKICFFEYDWFIHINQSYFLAYHINIKVKQLSLQAGNNCMKRNANGGFHWGIFSNEDALEAYTLATCPL